MFVSVVEKSEEREREREALDVTCGVKGLPCKWLCGNRFDESG